MKVLLESVFDHPSAHDMYALVAEEVRAAGHDVEHVLSTRDAAYAPAAYGLLISHGGVSSEWRGQIPCLGGPGWSRPKTLRFLEEHNVRTMEWSTAASIAEVRQLFVRWEVDRLLLKISDSHGGHSVEVFAEDQASRLQWDTERDVFCAEVNPSDGDVYKVEAFNGTDTITWMSRSKPLGQIYDGSYLKGMPGAYGERRLTEADTDLLIQLSRCSREATRRGIGYMSFDFMIDPTGAWVAIEANLELVATWWTHEFPAVRNRYAQAVRRLPIMSGRQSL